MARAGEDTVRKEGGEGMRVTIWLREHGEFIDSFKLGRISPARWCEQVVGEVAEKGGSARVIRNPKNNCEIAVDVTGEVC